jgi:hypothetical protein
MGMARPNPCGQEKPVPEEAVLHYIHIQGKADTTIRPSQLPPRPAHLPPLSAEDDAPTPENLEFHIIHICGKGDTTIRPSQLPPRPAYLPPPD